MPTPITRDVIADRLRDYARDNYLYIGSIMKGVALSIAAFVLMQVATDLRSNWTRISPLIASLAAILVSYITWGRGILVTNARANIGDSVFPLLMGIVEFVLFQVLWKDKEQPYLHINWFLVMAVHGYLACLLVTNRRFAIQFDQDFHADTNGVGILMLKYLRKDQFGAFGIGTGCLLVWLALKYFIVPLYGMQAADYTQAGFAVILTIVLCLVIVDADSQRRAIDACISA